MESDILHFSARATASTGTVHIDVIRVQCLHCRVELGRMFLQPNSASEEIWCHNCRAHLRLTCRGTVMLETIKEPTVYPHKRKQQVHKDKEDVEPFEYTVPQWFDRWVASLLPMIWDGAQEPSEDPTQGYWSHPVRAPTHHLCMVKQINSN